MEVKELSAISSDEIISILKEEIKNYDVISRDQEVGTVISVGDGIASVYGIDHAMYGEIVTLETGLKGMVQDIKENEISCILFGDDSEIKQGTKVCRTGKKAGIPVGEGYIGRIVDALGAPIDGKGEIKADGYRPVENEAPGIVERKSVSVPLETGILSKISQLSVQMLLWIGFFQMLALIPGTSRSGATIVGALLIGVSREVAAEFTFFLAIPAMFGASLLKLIKFGFHFTGAEFGLLMLGCIVSFGLSVIAIKFLMGYIKQHDFKVFGYYRIVLGALIILWTIVQTVIA